jgi:hypothetical protein
LLLLVTVAVALAVAVVVAVAEAVAVETLLLLHLLNLLLLILHAVNTTEGRQICHPLALGQILWLVRIRTEAIASKQQQHKTKQKHVWRGGCGAPGKACAQVENMCVSLRT